MTHFELTGLQAPGRTAQCQLHLINDEAARILVIRQKCTLCFEDYMAMYNYKFITLALKLVMYAFEGLSSHF
eukprot:1157870-Pelagomonas_calceolata.AAC.4